ncbi:MAG: exodeoxyribonuclease VII small subunit [Lachnospiraceae bacterium]|nr:exodeoxyribonuclease VII small subunit [Lachnospiraceae bacterium]
MARSKFSIENAFQELDQIMQQLEGDQISLSESMDLYKKGVKLLDQCNQTLDKTEKEIIILQEGEKDDIDQREDPREDE